MNFSDQVRNLLLSEQKRYPLAQIQDYYKVVFQSIFGAGHLIKNPTSAIQYLKEEWNSLEENQVEDLLTDISLNIPVYRFNLKQAKTENISLLEITDAFLKGCADFSNPIQKSFSKILQLLSESLKDDPFCFSEEEIKKILPLNLVCDFPIMHHSETYRNLYKPKYRVIPGKTLKREWCDIFPYQY